MDFIIRDEAKMARELTQVAIDQEYKILAFYDNYIRSEQEQYQNWEILDEQDMLAAMHIPFCYDDVNTPDKLHHFIVQAKEFI